MSAAAVENHARVVRRRLVAASRDTWGLDSVSASGPEGGYRFAVRFIPSDAENPKPAVPPHLEPRHFRIGGPAGAFAVDRFERDPAEADLLRLHVSRGARPEDPAPPGSPWRLDLADLPGVDPFFSSVEFHPGATAVISRFTDDCAAALVSAAPSPEGAFIDYLNKDYSSFRRLILDSFTLWDPAWRERSIADLGIVLAEILAYAGDYLSYYQDAAATEAYLNTARRRISVRRHARLTDYHLHEGSNTRVWVCFGVGADTELRAGTQLLSGYGDQTLVPDPGNLHDAPPSVRVFETMHAARFYRDHNRIDFYAWGARDFAVPEGATRAVFAGHLPHLQAGDVLIFEQTVRRFDGNCRIFEETVNGPRHAVRLSRHPRLGQDELRGVPITEVFWHDGDALPFDVTGHIRTDGEDLVPSFVACGNMVLADFGRTERHSPLPSPGAEAYGPTLPHRGITFAEPWIDSLTLSAAACLRQDPRRALPAVTVTEVPASGHPLTWTPRLDLLEAMPYERAFVVEIADDGTPHLRFGHGFAGRRPTPDAAFFATFRVGNGPRGGVSPNAITSVVSHDASILQVRNPLPASAGMLPESEDHARLNAPVAFRAQRRCVTPEDYRAIAREYPEVANVALHRQWTGSWMTDFLYVQRTRGSPAHARFLDNVAAYLEPYRLLGRDLYLKPPVYIPLFIRLAVHVANPAHSPRIYRALTKRFGTRGFFNPERFTFATPLYASELIAEAMIPGVTRVEVLLFEARTSRAARVPVDTVFIPGPTEIVRVDSDPAMPEHGWIEFLTEEGV